MAYVIGVLLFALGIGISLALHEAGHLLTAKAFGMKVRRYFVGIGPTPFSFRRGETEYGPKWLPFGGFCDIAGMTTLDQLTPDEERRAMWERTAWQRTTVMLTGPVTHFALAFGILYLLATTLGLPNPAQQPVVSQMSTCVTDARTTRELTDPTCPPGTVGPAQAAGIRPGDEVVAVGGTATPTWPATVAAVRDSTGPTVFELRRGGESLRLTVDVPRLSRPGVDGTVGVAGISAATSFAYGPLDGFGATAGFSADMIGHPAVKLAQFPQRIPAAVGSIFGAERDPDTPVSVVGASRIGGEAVEAGLWQPFFLLLAGLNFFMGVFNLLPLLPMDGGHIAIIAYERVRNGAAQPAGPHGGRPGRPHPAVHGDDGAGAHRRRGHAAHDHRGHRQPDPDHPVAGVSSS